MAKAIKKPRESKIIKSLHTQTIFGVVFNYEHKILKGVHILGWFHHFGEHAKDGGIRNAILIQHPRAGHAQWEIARFIDGKRSETVFANIDETLKRWISLIPRFKKTDGFIVSALTPPSESNGRVTETP
jgi:hypothetical protein